MGNKAFIIIIGIAILLVGGINIANHKNNREWVTINVTDKEIERYRDEDGYTHTDYFIYTEFEIYEVGADGLSGFGKAEKNLYKRIQIGSEYRVEVVRPLLNGYSKIVKAK